MDSKRLQLNEFIKYDRLSIEEAAVFGEHPAEQKAAAPAEEEIPNKDMGLDLPLTKRLPPRPPTEEEIKQKRIAFYKDQANWIDMRRAYSKDSSIIVSVRKRMANPEIFPPLPNEPAASGYKFCVLTQTKNSGVVNQKITPFRNDLGKAVAAYKKVVNSYTPPLISKIIRDDSKIVTNYNEGILKSVVGDV